MSSPADSSDPTPAPNAERWLVLGATGYVGSHLVPFLAAHGKRVRAAGRRVEALEAHDWPGVETVGADALEPASLDRALQGVAVAFYLVHSMAAGPEFPKLDRQAAIHFRDAAARAEVVPIEMDAEGILPHALEAACRRNGAQVLCLTTEAQNPTNGRMSVARRTEIAAIARRYDLQVIEDDCYSVSESDLPALRALAPERVWHVGSLSKTVTSALRFGWVICPSGMGEAGRLVAQHNFFALSRPVMELCLHLFSSGAAEEIRARVKAEFATRLQVMVNHLGTFDLRWQAGVPFVWLHLPQGWRASAFTRAAEARGVLVRPADEYALVGGRAPNAVRLAVAGNLPRDAFDAAVEKLAHLLRNPPADLSV